MADVALVKRWKISEALLKRAHRALPRPDKNAEEQFRALEKEFLEYLEHNEHVKGSTHNMVRGFAFGS